MNERGVGDPLVHGARRARPWEDPEARPRVAIPPRGGLDLESAETSDDCLDVDAAIARQLEDQRRDAFTRPY